ncbi:MAG: hypothetical protein HY299_16435 [Verrucomicrobia bacterium]|nr:hypothetical protein [Verrucomicrobiota bacterium]
MLQQRLILLALPVCLFVAGIAPLSQAADGRGYGVFKSIDFVQSDTNPPVLLNGPAYSFSAITQPSGLFSNQITRVTVQSPLGFVDELMAPPANTDQPFAFAYGSGSQADLDAYYPTGAYVLRISAAHEGNRVVSLLMTTNSFPENAPRVANHLAAQAVDPTVRFVLNWDPFVGGTTNDFISVSLVDGSNRVVFRSATFGEESGMTLLNGTNSSIAIPANTLGAGQLYYGYLFFEKDTLTQSTNYPGARGLVGFSKATSFTLQTSSLVFRLESFLVSGKELALRWRGDPGRTYVLQSLDNLGSTNWKPVATNVATGGLFTYTNVMPTRINAQFFRLLLQP